MNNFWEVTVDLFGSVCQKINDRLKPLSQNRTFGCFGSKGFSINVHAIFRDLYGKSSSFLFPSQLFLMKISLYLALFAEEETKRIM